MTPLQAAIRRHVRAAIARRVAAATWQHTNGDAVHGTSAQWGVDSWGDPDHRHELATGITATFDEETGELALRLLYAVQPLSCPPSCPLST